ncbi:MAG: hypothetical protein HC824_14630 [Synechococcales cyanobacterium RM1_1_8]|nr:hypothetical protein [Synechococcales cyanobacterium RM1_1_8]
MTEAGSEQGRRGALDWDACGRPAAIAPIPGEPGEAEAESRQERQSNRPCPPLASDAPINKNSLLRNLSGPNLPPDSLPPEFSQGQINPAKPGENEGSDGPAKAVEQAK